MRALCITLDAMGEWGSVVQRWRSRGTLPVARDRLYARGKEGICSRAKTHSFLPPSCPCLFSLSPVLPFHPLESTGKVKAHELRPKTKGELVKTLEELKADLAKLRVQQTTGGNAAKVARIGVVRKAIARVLTVTNQKAKKNVSRLPFSFSPPVSLFISPLPPPSNPLLSLFPLPPPSFKPFPPATPPTTASREL